MRGLGLILAILLSAFAMQSADSAFVAGHYAKSIDPNVGYTLTFSDDFTGVLDISADGPGTKWIWNKPGGGNFGDVGFGDVFSTSGGILTISLHKVSGAWHGGLMASVDQSGNGFSQTYGYFEMRAQLPAGLGSNWPAFWLASQVHVVTPATPDVEIDVMEQFGDFNPNRDNYTYHWWTSPPVQYQFGQNVGPMSDGFHTYGVDVESDYITFYFDRRALGSMVTPPEANTPLFVLVDLAISNTGSPNPATTDPSLMLVDYIHVYSKN